MPTELSAARADASAPAGLHDGSVDPQRRRTALRLPAKLREQLDARAVEGYPHEVCGLLLGRESPNGTVIERLERCRNLAADRLADRYVLDPDDFLAADQAARRDGLEIVGVWHTHPDHPARPSATDLEAAWEGYSYLIVSVTREGAVDRRAWRLAAGRFEEQKIEEQKIETQEIQERETVEREAEQHETEERETVERETEEQETVERETEETTSWQK